jgi:hypothetical protein
MRRQSGWWQLINHANGTAHAGQQPEAAAEVIAKISAWIDDGAPYSAPLIAGKKPKKDSSVVTDEDRQWWAFQPLKKVQAKSIDELLLKNAKGMSLHRLRRRRCWCGGCIWI